MTRKSARNLGPAEGNFHAPSDDSKGDSVTPLLPRFDKEEVFSAKGTSKEGKIPAVHCLKR